MNPTVITARDAIVLTRHEERHLESDRLLGDESSYHIPLAVRCYSQALHALQVGQGPVANWEQWNSRLLWLLRAFRAESRSEFQWLRVKFPYELKQGMFRARAENLCRSREKSGNSPARQDKNRPIWGVHVNLTII